MVDQLIVDTPEQKRTKGGVVEVSVDVENRGGEDHPFDERREFEAPRISGRDHGQAIAETPGTASKNRLLPGVLFVRRLHVGDEVGIHAKDLPIIVAQGVVFTGQLVEAGHGLVPFIRELLHFFVLANDDLVGLLKVLVRLLERVLILLDLRLLAVWI